MYLHDLYIKVVGTLINVSSINVELHVYIIRVTFPHFLLFLICHFYPSVPQATFLYQGGFLNFTKITGCPHVVNAMRLHQLCCNNKSASINLKEAIIEKMSLLCLAIYSVRSSIPLNGSSSMLELLETIGNSDGNIDVLCLSQD